LSRFVELGEQCQLNVDDFYLHLNACTLTFKGKYGLLESCLLLQDAFSLILEKPFSRETAYADETGEDDLRGHLRFLALHPNFPRLQQLPFLGKALGTDSERLHLQFQIDPLAPEKLSPLFVRIACWLLIGMVLTSLLVMLMVKLRLVVHEGTFFLLCLPYAHHSRLTKQRAAEKKAESALHCVFGLFFFLLSLLRTIR
jgi:hypothetical protein